tara:strand:- start:611 stop:1213 length:603 start_codon:yes stop_codon:yes gene_type:complete
LKFFLSKFFFIGFLIVFNGCSPFGSGSLKNFVPIQKNQKLINVELPKGYCVDENVGVSSDYLSTKFITNCVSIKQDSGNIFGRRPVDSIISLTVTDMKLPVSLSEKNFLNSLITDEKFENLVTNSNSIRLKVSKKTLKNGSVILDLQQTSTVLSVKKVRKYIFLVGQRITIMTIANFDKKLQPDYKKFESLIKRLKKASS